MAAPAARPVGAVAASDVVDVSGASRDRGAELGYAWAINQALGEEMRRDEKVWMHGPGRRPDGRRLRRDPRPARRVRRRARARHDDQRDLHRRRRGGRGDDRDDPGRRAAVRRLPAASPATRSSTSSPSGATCTAASSSVPVVVRLPTGVLGGAGAEHSQILEALGMHIARPQGGAAGDAGRRQGPAEDRDPRPQPGAVLRAQGPVPGEGRGARRDDGAPRAVRRRPTVRRRGPRHHRGRHRPDGADGRSRPPSSSPPRASSSR